MNQLDQIDIIIDQENIPKCSIHTDKFVSYGCLHSACGGSLLCQKCTLNHPHKKNTQYYDFLNEFIKKNKENAIANQNNWNVKVEAPLKQYTEQQFSKQFIEYMDNQLVIIRNIFQQIIHFANYLQELIGQLTDYKSQFETKYIEFIKEYQKLNQSAQCIQYFTPNVLNSKIIQQGSKANEYLKSISIVGQNYNILEQFQDFLKMAPDMSKQNKIIEELFIKLITSKDNCAEIKPFQFQFQKPVQTNTQHQNNQPYIGINNIPGAQKLYDINKQNQNIPAAKIDNYVNEFQDVESLQSSTQEIQVQDFDLKKKIYELEFKQLKKYKKWKIASILLMPQNLLVFLQKDTQTLTLYDFTNETVLQELDPKNQNKWLVQLTNELFISGGHNNKISVLQYSDKKIAFKSLLQFGDKPIVQALSLGLQTFVAINSLGTIFYYNLKDNSNISTTEFEVNEKKKNSLRLTLIEQPFKFGAYVSGESKSCIFQVDKAQNQIRLVNQMGKAPKIIWSNPKKCFLLSQSGLTIAIDEKSELQDREVDTIILFQAQTTYVVILPISTGICKRFIVKENNEIISLDQPDICEKFALNQFYYPRIQVFKGNNGKINVLIANPENTNGSLTLFEINFK